MAGANAPVRVVFFGTPSFSVPSLQRLADDPRTEVALVVTQPDRPAGRGRRSHPSPVKIAAQRLSIDCYQPDNLRTPELRQPLVDAQADLFVVAAFGMIFGRRLLATPRFGCLNLHASLLPRYRGASPIPAAILSGDVETGVSFMLMDEGLDTGPVLATSRLVIDDRDTTESLTQRLAELGASSIVDVVVEWVTGRLAAHPQDDRHASLTRPLERADGAIDWSASALAIDRRVRAMWPWPRAWTRLDHDLVQIHVVEPRPDLGGQGPPGSIQRREGRVVVTTGEGTIELIRVQPANRPALAAADWLNGVRSAAPRFAQVETSRTVPLIRPVRG